eukprot:gene11559-24172_t
MHLVLSHKFSLSRIEIIVVILIQFLCTLLPRVNSVFNVGSYAFVDLDLDKSVDPRLAFDVNWDPNPVSKNLDPNEARVKTKICFKTKTFQYCVEKLYMKYVLTSQTMWTRIKDKHNKAGPDTNALYCAPPSIAAYSDWVILPNNIGIFGITLKPHIIYLHTNLIPEFEKNILPYLHHKFILLTANNDHTIPINIDLRSDIRNITESWNHILSSPLLIHWFAENRIYTHKKVSTLPIGTILDFHHPDILSIPYTPLQSRIPKMIVADIIHENHIQWNDRRASARTCQIRSDICYSLHGNRTGVAIERIAWLTAISKYQFIAMTHGGGIDPCPKAFEAILIGTIPIIERNVLYDAYMHLPIVFVDNLVSFMSWDNVSIVLEMWLGEFDKYYELNSKLRNQTLYRLTTKYWYEEVISSRLHNRTLHAHSNKIIDNGYDSF